MIATVTTSPPLDFRAHAEMLRALDDSETLAAYLQAQCPAGVRFTGVQDIGPRSVYCFNVEAVAGTSFSIRPEYLSVDRIGAEHRAALARMAREARDVGGSSQSRGEEASA